MTNPNMVYSLDWPSNLPYPTVIVSDTETLRTSHNDRSLGDESSILREQKGSFNLDVNVEMIFTRCQYESFSNFYRSFLAYGHCVELEVVVDDTKKVFPIDFSSGIEVNYDGKTYKLSAVGHYPMSGVKKITYDENGDLDDAFWPGIPGTGILSPHPFVDPETGETVNSFFVLELYPAEDETVKHFPSV